MLWIVVAQAGVNQPHSKIAAVAFIRYFLDAFAVQISAGLRFFMQVKQWTCLNSKYFKEWDLGTKVTVVPRSRSHPRIAVR